MAVMSDNAPDLKRDLEDLVSHPAWLRLVAEEQQRWRDLLDTAAADVEDTVALQKIRQMVVAKREIERFIGRPKELLQRMSVTDPERLQPTTMSRGGI